jgi:hypothetical protein
MNLMSRINRLKKRIDRLCNAWLEKRSDAEYLAILQIQVQDYETEHGPIDLTDEPIPANTLRTQARMMREFKASFPDAIARLLSKGIALIDPDSQQGKRLMRGPWGECVITRAPTAALSMSP